MRRTSVLLALAVCTWMALGELALTQATAASSWSPALLVNTESFQVIDDVDTTANVVLRFGGTINKSLTYNRSLLRFQFDDDLYVQGNVDASGTLSGATVFAQRSLRSSGALVWEGAGSGRSLTVTGTSSLVGNVSIGTMTAATVPLEVWANTNNATVRAIFSGTPVSNGGGGSFQGLLRVTPTAADQRLGDASFGAYDSNGAARLGALMRGWAGEAWGTLASQAAYLTFETTPLSSTTRLERMRITTEGDVGIGSTSPDTKLEVVGAISGSTIYGKNSLRSSGSLVFEGSGSGSSLFLGTSLDGAGLTDCDTSNTSKLLWDATTKRFSCGTDQTGGGTGGGGGWADDGSVVRLETSGDQVGIGTASVDTGVKAEVIGILSGSTIHASSRLASSGVLVLRAPGNAQPTLYGNGSQKVGVNTASPHSGLTASGTFATSVRIATATGSINESDQIIFASGSSMISLTLPSAVGINGRQYTIKKTNSTPANHIRPVIVKTTSSQTIDRLSQWRLTNRGQQVTVVSDGANWQVVESSSYGLNGGYVSMGTTMNQWYSSPANATALTTAVFTTTATIRVIPFIAQKVMTINGMAVSVQTTAASAEVRLAIYNDTGRGYPDTLVVDAGTVATTTTGVRSICPSGCTGVGAGALPVTIQPGLYWLAINNNSIAHTHRGFAVSNLNAVTGYPSNYTTLRNVGWNIANAYGAFPSTFPTGASATTAVPIPAVTVRIQE